MSSIFTGNNILGIVIILLFAIPKISRDAKSSTLSPEEKMLDKINRPVYFLHHEKQSFVFVKKEQ